MVGCPRNRISSSSRACRTAGSTKLRPELAVRGYGTRVDWRGTLEEASGIRGPYTNVGCVGPSFARRSDTLLASYHTLRRSRPHPTVMLQPTETRDEFVPPRALSAPSGGTMTRRRTDDRHRGDARGLARRRSNLDAARPQPQTERAHLLGSAPSSPRTATSLWFRITSEAGRPLDEGADARRGPAAATAWSTSSSLGCRRTTRWTQIFARPDRSR